MGDRKKAGSGTGSHNADQRGERRPKKVRRRTGKPKGPFENSSSSLDERSRHGAAKHGGQRVGARSPAEVPADILCQLQSGTLETATLAEGLAIDPIALLANVLPHVGLASQSEQILAEARELTNAGYTSKIGGLGRLLARATEVAANGSDILRALAQHPSDTVRGMAAHAAVELAGVELAAILRAVRPFAADRHFGVREWAWMSVRPAVVAAPERALVSLLPWVDDKDANLRRFAVEVTRPRGVWCTHIETFKRTPEKGLPILEPLLDDPARYVQDSVANWLNDASKDQPAWVRQICKEWQNESPIPATLYITRRALRTLEKGR